MEGWDRMVSKRNKQEKWKLGKGHERMGDEKEERINGIKLDA